ncbi:MAG: 50S ribosomal protein L29 [Gemmatimonadaceae bacterium]|nr:50S ribosomal protein L29 [Gemmatimonadaceae bacterium]
MSKAVQTLTQMRDQPDDELREQLTRTRDELFRLHLGQHTNQVTSTAQLQVKRRDIARIMTILQGRKLGLETQAQKTATTSADASTEQPATKTKTKTTKKAKS